ncbi:WXG100-like domain-containing protein [Streptomyces sp. NPDC002911]
MSVEDVAKDLLMEAGMWWPDANSGTLRSKAKAWRTFAGAVDDIIGPVNNKAGSIILNNKGEAIDAFETFWGRYHKREGVGWLDDTAEAARAMAKALDEFADAVDDAIEQLWTEIAIAATIIAAGVGLAVFTFGASTAASAAATAAVIEIAAGLGVTVSTTVATIAATTLTGIAFGAIEGITIDLAVAQPLRMATGQQTASASTPWSRPPCTAERSEVHSEVPQERPVPQETWEDSVTSLFRTYPLA